jgi:hypothetical protein
MDTQYLNRLSPAVRALVSQVEAGAGIDIKVQLDRSRAGRGPLGAGILACDIDERGATVLIPSEDFFPEASVVHELLHVRRLLVEGVPRLTANFGYAGDPASHGTFLTNLDNSLEHLVIVPEELNRASERHEHWSQILERTFREDIPAIGVPIGVTRAALVQWAFLELAVPTCPARAIALDFLGARSLLTEAEAFVAAVAPLLISKPDLVKVVFEKLELPTEMAVLEYFDSHSKQSWERPL